MKKIILPVFILIVICSSCLKSPKCSFKPCDMVAPASEIQAVQNYLSSNALTAIQHCSGLFYTIDNPGTGKNPDACSAVAVTYTGKLTNGTVFDQHGSAVNFSLDGLITAWRVGIPILKEGGRIHLYVPPTLGYGSQQNGTIPPNSILIFDITLVAVH